MTIWAYGLCLFVFSGYKLVELYTPNLPIAHAYLEDLLALPIVLKSAELIIRVLVPGQREFRIKVADIIIITLIFAVYFELYLPKHDHRFTFDAFDILAYSIGALCYATLMKSKTPNQSSLSIW